MKTIPVFATLCSLLVATHSTFACSKAFLYFWQGTGAFGTSQKDTRNMGSVSVYLANTTVTSLNVDETSYDGECRTIGFSFSGTTSGGFSFNGTATPETGAFLPLNSPGFTMVVTSIRVTKPATGQVLATEDGGFKLDYIAIAPSPTIQVQRSAAGIALSWSTLAAGFVLDQADSAAAPVSSWTKVTAPLQTNGTTISVIIPTTNA